MYKITGIYPRRGIKDWENKKGYYYANTPKRWHQGCPNCESRLIYGVTHREQKWRRDLRDIPF